MPVDPELIKLRRQIADRHRERGVPRGANHVQEVSARLAATQQLVVRHFEEYVALLNRERAQAGLSPWRPRVTPTDTPELAALKRTIIAEQRRAAANVAELDEVGARCVHATVVKRSYGRLCRDCGEMVG